MKYDNQMTKADILTLLGSGHFNFALTVYRKKTTEGRWLK